MHSAAPTACPVNAAPARPRVPVQRVGFRAVNRHSDPGFQPGLQRHHLLPRQLLTEPVFGPLFATVGRDRIGFDDFRSNGLLLPGNATTALRIGLPLHRGPHHGYTALVVERVGHIERSWSALHLRAPLVAEIEAVQRLRLLQQALRRRLLQPARKPFALNRHDPLGSHHDFTELDAMVDALWPATELAL